jgi:hypothetical protein
MFYLAFFNIKEFLKMALFGSCFHLHRKKLGFDQVVNLNLQSIVLVYNGGRTYCTIAKAYTIV